MSLVLKCPRCGNEMVQGFVPDFDRRTAGHYWMEGPPQKGLLFRMFLSPSDGYPIGVFRCKGCGYLEFYADDEFAAK